MKCGGLPTVYAKKTNGHEYINSIAELWSCIILSLREQGGE